MLVIVIRTDIESDARSTTTATQPMREADAPRYIQSQIDQLRENPNPLEIGSIVQFSILPIKDTLVHSEIDVTG